MIPVSPGYLTEIGRLVRPRVLPPRISARRRAMSCRFEGVVLAFELDPGLSNRLDTTLLDRGLLGIGIEASQEGFEGNREGRHAGTDGQDRPDVQPL